MKLTDKNWPETVVESVNVYLQITGYSREQFLKSLSELAEQSVPDRFDQCLPSHKEKFLKLANHS